MEITFLEAEVPLTKTYEKKRDDTYVGGHYPGVYAVTSHVVQIQRLRQFAEALQMHASAGHCLLTNSLTEQVVNASRAKLSNKDELRKWILLDIDGIEGATTTEYFITKYLPTPFHSASYILQHSPSSGIKTGVRCHLFFLLEDEVDVGSVSSWLKYTNLATKSLSDQITLSKSTMALSFKLDWVANNNGRIVYITAPECLGFSDPVTDRIQLIEKQYDRLSFNFAAVGVEQMRIKYRDKLNALRDIAGLPVSKAKELYVIKGGREIVRDEMVDCARITDTIEDNERFMRCNLDGGDSYAYYYYRANPKYLHNFKGEPSIPLAKLDPEFFQRVAKPDFEKLAEKDERAFVFRDKLTDRWFIGRRKEELIIEQPNPISSEQKITDYFQDYGGHPPPDPIPSWNSVFNPTLGTQWLPDDKQFNVWRPSKYMLQATHRTLPPPLVVRIISHALGDHAETYEHFINWLAYIYQHRTKAGTAWVLHGCPGTGKGLLVNYIIAPIFGRDYVVTKQIRDLKSTFNGWMEKAIFVNLDEANTDDAGIESKQIVEALKLWITEPVLSIEAKFANAHMADSYTNFIFTTNDFGILPIQAGDRRFNVGFRQEKPLVITPTEVSDLKEELLHFAGYLSGYDVDTQRAHKTYESEAKAELARAAASSIDEFVSAITQGDFIYFEAGRDETVQELQTMDNFRKWLDRCIEDVKADRATVATVKELRDAYVILVGTRMMKANRFASLMSKRGHPAVFTRDGDIRRHGWRIEWDVSNEEKVILGSHLKVVKTEEQIQKEIENELRG